MFVNHDLIEIRINSALFSSSKRRWVFICHPCKLFSFQAILRHFSRGGEAFHDRETFSCHESGHKQRLSLQQTVQYFFPTLQQTAQYFFQLYSRLYNTFFSFTADCTISDKQQTAVLSRPAQNLARKSCDVLEVSSKGVPRKRFLPPDSLEKNENEDNLAKSWKPRDFQKGKISTKSYHRPRLNPNS